MAIETKCDRKLRPVSCVTSDIYKEGRVQMLSDVKLSFLSREQFINKHTL